MQSVAILQFHGVILHFDGTTQMNGQILEDGLRASAAMEANRTLEQIDAVCAAGTCDSTDYLWYMLPSHPLLSLWLLVDRSSEPFIIMTTGRQKL